MEKVKCPNPKCGRRIFDIEEMPPGKVVLENQQFIKNSKQKRYIHFGGRAAFHDECGLQCARCFYLRLTRRGPLREGGNSLRK